MQRVVAAIVRLGWLLAVIGLAAWLPGAVAGQRDYSPAMGEVAFGQLPEEAQRTVLLIQQAGPFPYAPKDGSVFGNFERGLQKRARGYYHEYAVPTPGRTDRGARRIVSGGGVRDYSYSDDHYRSFRHVHLP